MTKAQFPLSVVIGAVDRVSAPLHRARRSIQKSMLPILKLQKSLRAVAVSSGMRAVSDQMGVVMTRARGVASAVGSLTRRLGFMAAAAAAAFGGLLYSFTQAGDRILATSKKLGVSVEWLQEMQYAAERTGTPIEALDSSLGKLSRNIAEAAAGMGSAAPAFDALGVRLRDSLGNLRSAESVFDDVVSGLARLESQEIRNALAARIFGRSGIEMMPFLQEGAAGIEALRQRARELGIVMSADAVQGAETLGDSLADLRAAGAGLSRSFLGALAPALTDLANRLTMLLVAQGPKFREWAERFAEKLPERLEQLGRGMKNLRDALARILAPMRALADRFGAANVAAAAIAILLGGPLLVAVASLSASVAVLAWRLGVTTRILWKASGAGGLFHRVLNATAAMIARLIPVIASFTGFALGRMIGALKWLGATIWRNVIPAFWAWTKAILMNPMTWLVLGIGAVIFAIAKLGIWIHKHLDEIKGWFKAAYEWVTGIFSRIASAVAGAFSAAWQAVKDWFGGVWDWIVGKISWLWDWIRGAPKAVDGAEVNLAAPNLLPTGGGVTTERKNAHVTVEVRAPRGAEPRVGLKADRGMDLDLRTGVMNAAAG